VAAALQRDTNVAADILKQQGHYYDVNAVAYSPNGQLIATGGDDGKVKVWNATSGFCFVTFSEHIAPVTAITFMGKPCLTQSQRSCAACTPLVAHALQAGKEGTD
jgi:WD40 repeat protein